MQAIKAINDIFSIVKTQGTCRRPVAPSTGNFNPGEVGNPLGGDQEVEPTPDAPETKVEPTIEPVVVP